MTIDDTRGRRREIIVVGRFCPTIARLLPDAAWFSGKNGPVRRERQQQNPLALNAHSGAAFPAFKCKI